MNLGFSGGVLVFLVSKEKRLIIMSLTSMLNNDKEFGEILKNYIPKKRDFITNNGTEPFSKQPYPQS